MINSNIVIIILLAIIGALILINNRLNDIIDENENPKVATTKDGKDINAEELIKEYEKNRQIGIYVSNLADKYLNMIRRIDENTLNIIEYVKKNLPDDADLTELVGYAKVRKDLVDEINNIVDESTEKFNEFKNKK